MKGRFQPEKALEISSAASVPGPEGFDAGNPEFAASVAVAEAESSPPVVDSSASGTGQAEVDAALEMNPAAVAAPAETEPAEDPDAWRKDLASRLNSYRAKRGPRQPRYPSLQMKFDTYDPLPSQRAGMNRSSSAAALDHAMPAEEAHAAAFDTEPTVRHAVREAEAPENTGRIIPFPRSISFPPPAPLDELAEPVFSRPRILDVPDVEPPAPALGGILIESEEEESTERRLGIEIPLHAAAMSRRFFAIAADAVIVLAALSGFGYIFFQMTGIVPTVKQAAPFAAILFGIFWSAYQYLLLVYSGTTPGLMLARLHASKFDGALVCKRVRRWRVLASLLSIAPLGLGYFWCLLDEDQLCWHDRITGTYMAPRQ